MSTQSPFSWLIDAANMLHAKLPADFSQSLTPPPWVVSEVQQRMVLLLNHVLIQEPMARDRLKRQKGRQIQVSWRDQLFQFAFTPAGLLEYIKPDESDKAADLVMRVSEPSPFELTKTLLQGDKPAIRIEGDVQLAAEVNWLIDHVRWDLEEDLARLLGDVPSHALIQTIKRVTHSLSNFVLKQTQKAAP